jgi:thymidylate synthase
MTDTAPHVVDDTNLSRAWARALVACLDAPGSRKTSLIASVHNMPQMSGEEDNGVREVLDGYLEANEYASVHTVANTLFPEYMWDLAGHSASAFYQMYAEALPKIKAQNRGSNGRGTYLERLLAYGSGPHPNQLAHIIETFTSRNGVRHSALQASVFDPVRDHVRQAQLAFPCLQHLSFVPTDQGLLVNAFYATQQVLFKAYGNYLGLWRLGSFVAGELGCQMHRLTCYVGEAKIEGRNGSGSKRALNNSALGRQARDLAASYQPEGSPAS